MDLRHAAQDFKSGVVVYLSIICQDAAVSVVGVSAEAEVGYDAQVLPLGPQRPHGPRHEAIFGQGTGGVGILRVLIGHPENKHGGNIQRAAALAEPVHGIAKDTRQ